jgi:N-acetylmuramoyl-L-alanine amidase
MKPVVTLLLILALVASGLLFTLSLSAADGDFLIYFENSTLALKSQTIDRTTYLPLADIVRHMGLAFTDATALLTFTIQGQNSRLVLTPGSAFVAVNDQPILLQSTVRRENGQWFVPLDFLSQGLSRVAGFEFRYRPGTRRVFAGRVQVAELAMNAQALGGITRLTLRSGYALDVELQKEMAQRRATLALKGRPIDPARERLDYRDGLLQSVTFDDSEGLPRLIVTMTDDVRDVRISSAEDNRVYFVDFIKDPTAESPPTPVAANVNKPMAPNFRGNGVRVIVIDAGHGGIDSGTTNAGTLEKDLTLSIARRLRTALQSRMAATVILTRESDVVLSNEARAAVANNNQGGLFVSLHVGFSPDPAASGSSIYVMSPEFTGGFPQFDSNRLFFPWYMAYRSSRPGSAVLASQLQLTLRQSFPGLKFPIRSGPLGVLTSATMPAVAVEIGNLNNEMSAKMLTDEAFQTKVAGSIAAGIERFASAVAGTRQP